MSRARTRRQEGETPLLRLDRWLGAVAFVVLLSSVSACGNDVGPPEGSPGEDGATDQAGGDTVLVLIRDGPDAGEHRREGVGANCSIGVEPDAFGVQFADVEAAEGLAALQVIVPGAAGAAGGVNEFLATATIGSLEDGTEYEITSGTATVDVEAEMPTLTIEGTTAEGTGVNVQVACGSVHGA